jgi:putative phage-type endonuclease
MEDALKHWILDNRPYTHLNSRLKHFMIYCQQQCPGLSWTQLKKVVLPLVDKLMLGEVGRIWVRDRAYERVLRLYGVNDQRSAQWHAKRGEMITASEVYKVFSTPEARREVMLRKLEPPVPSNGTPAAPLLWGTRFEPVAKKLYEKETKCQITDVSCAQHPVYSFLGASPDGLIVPNDETDIHRYGRLVEFKCPMSRALKDEIPVAYVHQMQMQMECTGIDECEYVEFRFKQVNYNEWCKAEGEKGSFVVHIDGSVEYDQADTANEESQVVYWVLTSMKKDFVPKDPNWLSDHIGQLETFWLEVLRHREQGTLPEPIEKTIAKMDV